MIRIAALVLLGLVAIEAIPANHEHAALWNDFKQTHGKTYSTIQEEIARFNIFIENHLQILEHNKEFQAGMHTFEVGMNKFGDMTNQEFRSMVNGYKRTSPKANANVHKSHTTTAIPDSVDWRTQGYVTGVKDQGQCGACWAFSTTGSLEGQHFKKSGTLTSLSEQNLVDCVKKDAGCGGGFMDDAFAYIKSNQGVDTEASYPYTARNGKCHYSTSNIGATDSGFVDVTPGSESDLENAIATIGPISVAIDASKNSFQFYKQGVYYEAKCGSAQEDLDHGVLAVGYGATSDGQKYYIVKNSWGDSWGDKGYINMSREKSNNCGIATDASYPTV